MTSCIQQGDEYSPTRRKNFVIEVRTTSNTTAFICLLREGNTLIKLELPSEYVYKHADEFQNIQRSNVEQQKVEGRFISIDEFPHIHKYGSLKDDISIKNIDVNTVIFVKKQRGITKGYYIIDSSYRLNFVSKSRLSHFKLTNNPDSNDIEAIKDVSNVSIITDRTVEIGDYRYKWVKRRSYGDHGPGWEASLIDKSKSPILKSFKRTLYGLEVEPAVSTYQDVKLDYLRLDLLQGTRNVSIQWMFHRSDIKALDLRDHDFKTTLNFILAKYYTHGVYKSATLNNALYIVNNEFEAEIREFITNGNEYTEGTNRLTLLSEKSFNPADKNALEAKLAKLSLMGNLGNVIILADKPMDTIEIWS